jgi:Putative beta-barrel porin-2, OmpL-like. bbp2
MALRRRWTSGIAMAWVALSAMGLSVPAFAQGVPPKPAHPAPVAPPTAPLPAAAPAAPLPLPPVAPAPSTPAPAAAPAAVVPEEPLPAATGSLPELPPPAVTETAAHELADVTPAADEDWYDAFDVRLFADAYFSWNYNSPKPQIGGNDVTRAFDSANGFALAWAGLDVSHAADPVGGALSLRFGPSARRYNSSCAGTCDAAYGLENVKQAYASWRPGGATSKVSIDFGKFDTIYGAEVAESQDNINYTRGVLYWLGQPAFHTGFRVNAELTPSFTLRALAVNGWNDSVDNNTGKTFGVQATVRAARSDSHDWVSASLGYLGGPEQSDIATVTCAAGSGFDSSSATGCTVGGTGGSTGTVDRPTNNSKGWRHFIDLVATSDPLDALHLVLNADLGVEGQRDSVTSSHFTSHSWLGGMLGARYLLGDHFAVAGRGELYWDKDGLTLGYVGALKIHDALINTATLTLDYLPSKNLLIRLDNRLDHSTRQIFPKGLHGDPVGDLFTTTLGVVVTTN